MIQLCKLISLTTLFTKRQVQGNAITTDYNYLIIAIMTAYNQWSLAEMELMKYRLKIFVNFNMDQPKKIYWHRFDEHCVNKS